GCSEIDRAGIVDRERRSCHSFDDVADVREVSVLLPVSPDLVGIHADESLRDECDHGMRLVLALAVRGEQPARDRLKAVLLPVSAKGHLPHQLGPPVLAVCGGAAMLERIGPFLAKVDRLTVDGLLLEVHWIHASGTREAEAFDAGAERLVDDIAIEDKIRRAVRGVSIDEAAPPVSSREMKAHFAICDSFTCECPVSQIAELELDALDAVVQVRERAAGKVVGDANAGAAIHEQVDEMAPDERRAARDEDPYVTPLIWLASVLCVHSPSPSSSLCNQERPSRPFLQPSV